MSRRTTFTLGASTNQTLSGNGTVAGAVTVNAGGTVSPGASAIGTLMFSSNLTFNSGGAAFFELNKTNANGPATNDYLVVSGALSVTSGVLTVTNTGPALVLGDSFKLLSQPASGFTTVTLPALGSGLAWTNNLAVDGSIAVVSAGGDGSAPGYHECCSEQWPDQWRHAGDHYRLEFCDRHDGAVWGEHPRGRQLHATRPW